MRWTAFLILFVTTFAVVKATKPCCPVNEVYSKCGNNACQNTCDDPNRSLTCKATCVSGCVCVQGYLRNSNGKCVSEKDCPKKTPKPKKPSTKPPLGCTKNPTRPTTKPTKKCTGKPTTPPTACTTKRTKATKPTTQTTTKTTKITKPTKSPTTGSTKTTKPSCPKDEFYDCGSACDRTCATLGEVCPIVNVKCVEMCYCISGFARDANGICIPIKECPPRECPTDPNAVIVPCGDPCPTTCENKDDTSPRPCPKICIVNGCKCKDGYVKGSDGKCTLTRNCPPKCNKNEVYDLCGNTGCVNTCLQPDLSTRCKPAGCNPGCICVEGYLRNSQGECVAPSECPSCSGPNEFYDCGSACDKTCATLGEDCPIVNVKCTEMCYCKDGYARDGRGVCIPDNECPPRDCPTDPNAIIMPCGDPCPTTCENKDDTSPRPCPRICIRNGCKCKDGYVKGSDGKCTLARNCPPKCNKNEVYDICGNTGCVNTCLQPDLSTRCKPAGCNPGCICVEGYLRNSQGECVAPSECPSCSGLNEFYDCGSACDKTCATLGEDCPIINKKCVEMCYCKDGFARDGKGICIPDNECPPRECPTDPNAIIVPCGDPCPTTCENKDDTSPRPCPRICIRNGCKCKDGYVKGSDGKCTLVRNCPIKPVDIPDCDKNEVLDKCFRSCPPETTCETYFSGAIVDCAPPPKDAPCVPACRCAKGYIRSSEGKCIKPKKCCTDCNSELRACPNPCDGGTCEQPEFSPCKRKCNPFGCQCKDGYVKKSDSDPTCVPLSSCCEYSYD